MWLPKLGPGWGFQAVGGVHSVHQKQLISPDYRDEEYTVDQREKGAPGTSWLERYQNLRAGRFDLKKHSMGCLGHLSLPVP